MTSVCLYLYYILRNKCFNKHKTWQNLVIRLNENNKANKTTRITTRATSILKTKHSILVRYLSHLVAAKTRLPFAQSFQISGCNVHRLFCIKDSGYCQGKFACNMVTSKFMSYLISYKVSCS